MAILSGGKMTFQVGDILVYKTETSCAKTIATITGYGYKSHLKCYAYDIEHHFINWDGSSRITNYETEALSLKIMVDRDGYIYYPVIK